MAIRAHRQTTLRLMSIFIGLSAAAFVIFVSIPRNSMLNIFERKVYDGWMILRGSQPENENILIFGITSDDLQMVGKWPWSGWFWGDFLQRLSRYRPAAVVFDVLFTESELGLLEDVTEEEKRENPVIRRMIEDFEQSQKLFTEGIRRCGNVYLAGYLDMTGKGASTDYAFDPSTQVKSFRLFKERTPRDNLRQEAAREYYIPEGRNYILPLPELAREAKGIGFINADPDPDGITRRTQLLARMGSRLLPSLDLLVVADYLGVPLDEFDVTPGRHIRFTRGDHAYRIPITPEGQMHVNFKGKEAYIHRGISITGFLAATEGLDVGFSLEDLEGKIILIGMLAEGTSDIRAVSVDPYYPLVGVHATVIDNILSRDHIHFIPDWMRLLLLGLTGLLIGVLMPMIRPTFGAMIGMLGLVLIGPPLMAFVVFDQVSYWIPTLQPALTMGLGFSGIAFYYFITERVQRKQIQEVFGRCVARTVVDQIIDSGLDPQLGGNRRTVTVMFSDIRGFTPYTEKHSAEDVVHILNEYFTAMSDVIFKYGGTIDKYMGDAIMVFFGDPLPMQDHAERAVRTALEMQQVMKTLQIRWGESGFSQGIGIQSGEVIVGWMGSPSKKEYTVIGDTVNTAFRIESIAEAGQVLISQSTFHLLKDMISVRPLEPVKLKGKSDLQQVYEVLSISKQASDTLESTLSTQA